MNREPPKFDDAHRLADAIIEQTGKRIVLALPLGLGKANLIVNGLRRGSKRFRRMAGEPLSSPAILVTR